MRADHLNQGLGCFEGWDAVASPLGQRIAIELPQACERTVRRKIVKKITPLLVCHLKEVAPGCEGLFVPKRQLRSPM